MRRVIVSNIASLDGFYEGPDRDVMALNMDEAFDAYNLERIRAAGTVLLGRASFEGFSGYWPFIADAPEDPGNRALSSTNRELSRIYNGIPKVVVSDTIRLAPDHPWTATTEVLRREALGDWLEAERHRGAGDILVFASHTLWNDLLGRGLVDEVHVMIGPAALGAGTPLFDRPARLRLLDCQGFDGSENLLVRYGT
jgi:dihydrofolate reductase